MAWTKATMIFEYTAGAQIGLPQIQDREGGWSESFYTNLAVTDNNLVSQFGKLMQARAQILPSTITIVGQRFQTVNPVGASMAGTLVIPGAWKTSQDIPQMALTIQMRTPGNANRFTFTMRGIPDDQISFGKYLPGNGFNNALSGYILSLAGWNFRGLVLNAATFPIATIANNGDYVLAQVGTFAAGNNVKVLRSLNAQGRRGGQTVYINSLPVPTATTGNLLNWKRGPSTGGQMRLNSYGIFPLTSPDYSTVKAATRKVGRPSKVYRGRVSARRS